jgi:hypothetical protein
MSDKSEGRMPQNVVSEWNAIRSAACELHWFWRFHKDLCGNTQHVALMQEILPGPFALIRRAFLFSITMGMGRLLDPAESRVRGKKRPNLSLKRLVKESSRNNFQFYACSINSIDSSARWSNSIVGRFHG